VVRVAHFDTGYDPDHLTLPAKLQTSLAWNFVNDGQSEHDATDHSAGLANNIGHGTGTLGILAGKALSTLPAIGAAPFIEVVPMRVSNSVVLFYNGDITNAFRRVRELTGDPATRIDVITMSMGGLASLALAEQVNAVYEQGVFIVTAAGNNLNNFPTHNIVFPARFNRVVAACGVMSNFKPYADLGGPMAGNYGPSNKMNTALSAFTPNTPWARFRSPSVVDFNGAGTSSATPQIAAAAAIWLQNYMDALRDYRGWQRVEAVRKALFDSALPPPDGDTAHFGRGIVRAHKALEQLPAAPNTLHETAPDSSLFPFFRTLFGIGLAADGSTLTMPPERLHMLELEALHLAQSTTLEHLLAQEHPSREQIREALLASPRISEALRAELKGEPPSAPTSIVSLYPLPSSVLKLHLDHATNPKPARPTKRRLRVYAYDPSLGTRLETLGINEAVLDVPWEDDLAPGPVGEYLEVVDVDVQSNCCYAPIDLNDPYLLVQDGLPPSDASPQFQQQMAYAIAMSTIGHFERALGRAALWAPRAVQEDNEDTDRYVQRLRIYPHGLRAANAYYSPQRKALLLGYFAASKTRSVDILPGGLVFTALSSDIIAHETTHALLDGLHRGFLESTNPDVLAFHEAFADVVALFHHFSMPEALHQAIAVTSGDLGRQSLLAALAVEFGRATGKGAYAGLRNAVGQQPSPTDYQKATEAHDRGAVLVAAVFDAFLQIYRSRSADLLRLATGGSGIPPQGAISHDLVIRLAQEASKAATHVLEICIRALDYCPAVDITFGEYLRALITADRDLVPEDERGYRVAFVSAFRDRGIYPANVKSLSEDSLVWEAPPVTLPNIEHVVNAFSLDWDLLANREAAFRASREDAGKMRRWLLDETEITDDELTALGIQRSAGPDRVGDVAGQVLPFTVHSVRPARRVGPDGQLLSDVVVDITQKFQPDDGSTPFRGGCTLLIGLKSKRVRYFVSKRVKNDARFKTQRQFALDQLELGRGTYFEAADTTREPFAFLHRGF
jgi:hypothetical protein